MTLNVNYNGNHIGFVAKSYPENRHLFMIALTSLKVEDVTINFDRVKSFLARAYGSTNFFGKIDEDRLEAIMDVKKLERFEQTGTNNYEDFLRYKFMKTADERGYEIETLYQWEELEGHIEGYLLLDFEHAVIKENTIQLEEDIHYFTKEKLSSENLPIFAEIIEYPIIRTEIMGAGEGLLLGANFSDFGGRNHSHETELILKSGNYQKKYLFPITMNVKKGMPVQLYVEEGEVRKIFCDEVIYEFL